MATSPDPDTRMRMTWTNLVLKLIGYTLILYFIEFLYPALYPTFSPILLTSVVLTLVGSAADWTVLPRMGNLRALSLGWLGMTIIIWGVAQLWPGTHVPIGDAIIMALCLGPLEYALHRWLFHVA